MNILLIKQNLALRSALDANTPTRLKTGDQLSPFAARDLSGNDINVKYGADAPNRVLLFFSPRCRYSALQFAAWTSIIRDAPAKQIEVLLVAMESEEKSEIDQFLKSVDCPPESKDFRVALISGAVKDSYKFGVTPTTVVVSNTGVIQQVWNGMANAEDLATAYSKLGLLYRE
jgi:hypothetical protein